MLALRPLRPVDVSALWSLPAQRSRPDVERSPLERPPPTPGRPVGRGGITLTLSSVPEDAEEEKADAFTERAERAGEGDQPLSRFPPERDLSLPEWERSRSGGKHGRGRSPSPACSARSVSASAFSSSASSGTEERVNVMPPPPTGRPGMVVALRVTGQRLAVTAGREDSLVRSHRPGKAVA